MPGSVAELALRVVLRTTVVFAVTWTLLRAGGEGVADLGVTLGNWPHSLVVGGTAALLVFAVVTFAINPLAAFLLGGGGDQALRPLFRDPREAPYWIASAILGGGFAEELERAFVLTRFEKLSGRGGLAAAFVVSSVVFGLGHLYQGPASALSIGVTGALMGLVFLRRRRAIEAMVAHAGFDLISIALAYLLYAS